jgi:protein SCO1/2
MAHRPLARFVRATVVALAAAGALGGTLVLEGCGQQPPAFSNLDITGNTQFGKDFSLPDTSGKTRTLAD